METFGIWFAVLWGGGVSALMLYEMWRDWCAKRWSTTTGRVLEAGTRYHKARRGGYLPSVRYEYSVDGQLFVSERLRFGGVTLRSERAAKSSLGPITMGADVTVRYDPRRPNQAVIQVGILASDILWLLAGLAVLAFGLAQMYTGARAG